MVTLPLFPLNTILFPGGHLPLQIFEVRYLDLVKRCIENGEAFGVVPLLEGSEVRVPGQHEKLSGAGTMARIIAGCAGRRPAENLLHRHHALPHTVVRAAEEWPVDGEVVALNDDLDVPVPSEQQDVANALATLIRSLQKKQISERAHATGAAVPAR
jgi:hypothetical protein